MTGKGGRASRRGFQIVASVLLGLVCLWVVFRSVDGKSFATSLASTRPPWVLASGLCFATLHLLRAFRWGALIQPIRPVSARSYVSICSIGFLLINAIPARLGELARPVLLHEREGIPFGASMATVVVERTLEILSLAIMGLLVVAFADVPVQNLTVVGLDVPLVEGARVVIGTALVPFAGCVAGAALLGDRAPSLARWWTSWMGPGVSGRIEGFVASFVFSVQTLRSPRLAATVLAYTLVTWLLNVACIWCMFRAFPALDLPALDGWGALVSLVVLVIGVMIPLSGPGFIGVFELFCGLALGLYGVQAADAAAFGVVLHAVQITVLCGFGFLFLFRDPISFGSLWESLTGGESPSRKPA